MNLLDDSNRLVIVTGKGGVGKSLLAAALARCSAAAGRRTVLVTLDTRHDRHPIIGAPLAYRPRETGHGFRVSRLDAFEAAAEYARRSLPFAGLYETFFKGRVFHDFAAAAPGFEELMSLGKLYQLATESEFQRVVFDAPATGHLRDLLAVPGVTQRAVRVGPLNHNARRIEDLLLDPDRTRVLVATLAEELPVREALETVALCREMRLGLGPVLVNRWLPRRFSRSEVAAVDSLIAEGTLSPAGADVWKSAGSELAEVASQREAVAALEAAGVVWLTVPRIVQPRYDGDALVAEAARHLAAATGLRLPPEAASPEAPSPEPVAAERPASRPGAPRGPVLDLPDLVRSARVVVCCGSGGVGKTTSAAALGVLGAKAGLRVRVMTIDPARRLAQAMGLDTLSHEPQPVPLEAPGTLSAMMLDSKRAFDRLVETYAPSAEVREAIFANHYYQQLTSTLGGSRELAAMERVLEVVAAGDHDLLVVDTPPSQHALDFLEAPERIVSLLDGTMTRWLVRPYGVAARAQFKVFRQSSAMALRFMERFTGVQMLADLSDFLLAFSSMFDGFKERSHRVQALMRDASTAFLLVCSPEPASLAQVDRFAARLERDRMRIGGVLANRVHPAPAHAGEAAPLPAADVALLAEAGDPAFSDAPLPDRLQGAWLDARDLHLADRRALEAAGKRGLPLHVVPRFAHDLHSMADLEAFAERLEGEP